MVYSPIHINKQIGSEIEITNSNILDENDLEKCNNIIHTVSNNNNKKGCIGKFQEIKVEEIMVEIGKILLIFAYLAVGIENLLLNIDNNKCISCDKNNLNLSLGNYFIATGILAIIYFIFMFDKFLNNNFLLDKILLCGIDITNKDKIESRKKIYYIVISFIIMINQLFTIFGIVIFNSLTNTKICSLSIMYYLLFQIIVRLCESFFVLCCVCYLPMVFCRLCFFGFN
jgi:hypothetical protein